jgi:hypothetical protein
LWRALLLALVEQLRQRQSTYAADEWKTVEQYLDRLVVSLYRNQTYTEKGHPHVNWKAAAPLAMQAALGFVPGVRETIGALKSWLADDGSVESLTKIIERDQISTFRDQIASMEQFRATLEELVTKYVTRRPDGRERRLYVFIDDLDRCLPEAAVGALEALKLFLDVPGCVFVLGMDRTVVEQGIRVRYRDLGKDPATGRVTIDSRQYLDKIIQIPFTLPPLDKTQIEGFIAHWCEQNGADRIGRSCSQIVAQGVSANPRSLKRTLNVLRLVAELRPDVNDTQMEYLAKIVVLQTSYDELYQDVIENPQRLADFETSPPAAVAIDSRLRAMMAHGRRFNVLSDEERALVYTTRVSAG